MPRIEEIWEWRELGRWMDRQNWNVTELAASVQVSRQTVYRWLKKEDFPTRRRTRSLAVALSRGDASLAETIYAELYGSLAVSEPLVAA